MKIDYIQVSNVLSFPYFQNIADAPALSFDDGLNIIIGQNGSGKSTSLEIINFLFKRVLYRQYQVNQELLSRRSNINADERKQIIAPVNHNYYTQFRLTPNWDTPQFEQRIRASIRLDQIDLANISTIRENGQKIQHSIKYYSRHNVDNDGQFTDNYVIDVILNPNDGTFSTEFISGKSDFGYSYLAEYHFFKEAIAIHNLVYPKEPISPLHESFTIISSYRNYHAFQPSISLRDSHPAQQIQSIRSQDYDRSLNANDSGEPAVFALVRLQVAERHFNMISQAMSEDQCEIEANKLPFIMSINAHLRVVSLACKIRLIDLRTWQYAFEFFDTRREKPINDINSLSAGQKAIIHLVFESYGRGDLKGGVVIIDEPEIHLHYQFQHEYLQVINQLNSNQDCQYILVTHSEALINSTTIHSVRRFSLNESGHTEIFSPRLTSDQKSLIKILDNTRSTYAFFARKVLLVEGDTDRYFARAVILSKYPQLEQELAVLHIGGKGEFRRWNSLFSSFGLTVFCLADFDYVTEGHYQDERATALKNPKAIAEFKIRHPDWEQRIESEYPNRVYILKEGDLEFYLGIPKGLDPTIAFCRDHLDGFLADQTSSRSFEMRDIFERILS